MAKKVPQLRDIAIFAYLNPQINELANNKI